MPMEKTDLLYVLQRLKPQDLRELSEGYSENMIIDTYNFYSDSELSYCGLIDEPIACGGIKVINPHTGYLWMFSTPDFPKIAKSITKFMKERIKDSGFERVFTTSADFRLDAHRWLEVIGLRKEGILRGYGRTCDFYSFSRTI